MTASWKTLLAHFAGKMKRREGMQPLESVTASIEAATPYTYVS
jgi:hypothetical protein